MTRTEKTTTLGDMNDRKWPVVDDASGSHGEAGSGEVIHEGQVYAGSGEVIHEG